MQRRTPRRPLHYLSCAPGSVWYQDIRIACRKTSEYVERPTVGGVARAVVRVSGEFIVGAPKSRAALRTVPLPDALGPVLAAHITRFGCVGHDGLVFPAASGGFLNRDTVKDAFRKASAEIGCPGLRFHDLRHSAATLFAQAGATLADHMTLMGHTSPAMSARYTHSTATRTRQLAQRIWA